LEEYEAGKRKPLRAQEFPEGGNEGKAFFLPERNSSNRKTRRKVVPPSGACRGGEERGLRFSQGSIATIHVRRRVGDAEKSLKKEYRGGKSGPSEADEPARGRSRTGGKGKIPLRQLSLQRKKSAIHIKNRNETNPTKRPCNLGRKNLREKESFASRKWQAIAKESTVSGNQKRNAQRKPEKKKKRKKPIPKKRREPRRKKKIGGKGLLCPVKEPRLTLKKN